MSWRITWPCSLQRELLRSGDRGNCSRARTRTIRRPGGRGAPALARCDEGEDHGSTCVDRNVCVLVAAVSVLAVGLLWQELIQARRMVADQAAAQVAEARLREQEVLLQLREVAESVNRLRAPNLSDLHLTLLDDTVERARVVGASVDVTCLTEEPRQASEWHVERIGQRCFRLAAAGQVSIRGRAPLGGRVP